MQQNHQQHPPKMNGSIPHGQVTQPVNNPTTHQPVAQQVQPKQQAVQKPQQIAQTQRQPSVGNQAQPTVAVDHHQQRQSSRDGQQQQRLIDEEKQRKYVFYLFLCSNIKC